MYVNGEKYDPVQFGQEGSARIADIDLHQYWNSVVALWKPDGRSLSFRWRNRQNQPEVEFEFK